jgi:hypothetical protein
MDEREAELIRDFELAQINLHKYSCEDAKGVHKYEGIYGAAYQKLAKAGLKPRLRTKYRPR